MRAVRLLRQSVPGLPYKDSVSMRALGIDLGKVRIGTAVSDYDGRMALPSITIDARGLMKNVAAVLTLAEKSEATLIVVGMPVKMDGTLGPAAEFTQRFVQALREGTDIEVATWDERLTSSQANKLMVSADVSRKDRKGAVDSMAAAIMLQSYLDAARSGNA